jgi:hypothetical protein
MSNQLARLFLRGSLMNETAKLLTKDEMKEVDALMKTAWEDPNIQGQKMEFCMALGRTIGNEYKDIEVGKQDCQITFWKAALMVLFHESRECTKCERHFVTSKTKTEKCPDCNINLVIKWSPKPQIANDPIKRKKFFQSVMFNYLRQILRENKPPSIKEARTEEGNASDIATKAIAAALNTIKNYPHKLESIDMEHNVIRCETGLLPIKTIQKLQEIKHEFESYGVQISLGWTSINVVSILEVPQTISYQIVEKVYAKYTSLDSGSTSVETEASHRDHCEHKALSRIEPPTSGNENLDLLRGRLSGDAQRLFDLIVDTPQDYIERFGTDKLHRANLANYLNKDIKDIDAMRENIKLHCLAMDIMVK